MYLLVSLEKVHSWARKSGIPFDEDNAERAKKRLREEARKCLRRLDTTYGSGCRNVRNVL
jgi:hypothetical protein